MLDDDGKNFSEKTFLYQVHQNNQKKLHTCTFACTITCTIVLPCIYRMGCKEEILSFKMMCLKAIFDSFNDVFIVFLKNVSIKIDMILPFFQKMNSHMGILFNLDR